MSRPGLLLAEMRRGAARLETIAELTARLDPKKFTIETVPARMKKMKEDPIVGVLEDTPDLSAALEHLGNRLKR